MNVFAQVVRPADGVAWVTGASGGIGRAVCLALVAKGWEVHATARSAEKLAELAAEAAGPGRIVPLPADVTDGEAMREAVARATATRPMALALLNAGVYLPMRAQEFDAAKARATFDVNLTGVANGLDPVLKHMIARRAGHVAVTASVAGYRGLPQAAAYSASKAGLIAMCESLALDLIDCGVRISVVNPGFVDTEATAVNDFEMPFLMKPEAAAAAIVKGLERPGFEIAFPTRFVLFLRAVGWLPNQWYFKAWRRLTKK